LPHLLGLSLNQKLNKMEPISFEVLPNGFFKLTAVVNSQLITRKYIYCTKREAKKLFKAEIRQAKARWYEYLAR
jgi:hypothetical protein